MIYKTSVPTSQREMTVTDRKTIRLMMFEKIKYADGDHRKNIDTATLTDVWLP
jgi:hypothetical protein